MRVYFCHASDEKPLVRELIALMKGRSAIFRPWIDERELRVGDHLKKSLQSAIKSSDFVVALLSRGAIHSKWVKYELQTAREDGIAILAIVVGLDPEELPGYIRKHRYLVLHDRSEREIQRLVSELCENIADWMTNNDTMISFLKAQEQSCELHASATQEGEEAATVNLALADFFPKLIQAVYRKEYAGIESEHYPPSWLVKCCNFAILHSRISRGISPETLQFIDRFLTLLGQCFLVGYYAIALRRPIAGITVDESVDYDEGTLWAAFDKVKKEMSSELDGHVWNLGLTWVESMYVWLTSRKAIPKREDTERLFTSAMFSGLTIARAVEQLALTGDETPRSSD